MFLKKHFKILLKNTACIFLLYIQQSTDFWLAANDVLLKTTCSNRTTIYLEVVLNRNKIYFGTNKFHILLYEFWSLDPQRCNYSKQFLTKDFLLLYWTLKICQTCCQIKFVKSLQHQFKIKRSMIPLFILTKTAFFSNQEIISHS